MLLGTVDGAVRIEPPIFGDVPFSPEVYFDGAYRPICFDNVNSNGGVESVGNAVCLAAGFNGGARVVQNKHKAHERDAIPVRELPRMLPFSVAWHWEDRGVGRGYDCIVNPLSSPPPRASSTNDVRLRNAIPDNRCSAV